MKIIIDSYIYEALQPSHFRKLMQVGRDLAIKRIGGIWDKLKSQADGTNRNGDRLYFNLQSNAKLNSENEITEFLKDKGYKVLDFNKGIILTPKNIQIKIGKVLTFIGKDDSKALDLLKKYNDEKSDTAMEDEYIMVISKSAYDLAGMSTNRNWSSCMDLREQHPKKHYVAIDIERGTLISYLLEKTDKNINNPVSRILIKPYLQKENEENILYGIESGDFILGKKNPDYIKKLISVLDKAQGDKIGVFKWDMKIHADGFGDQKKSNLDKLPQTEFLDEFGIKDYTIDEKGFINVHQEFVYLGRQNLNSIPIKFGVVDGSFNISRNNLKTLENAPIEVKGHFICELNDLTSLEGAPKKIGGDFVGLSQKNGHKFTEEEVRAVCDVKGNVRD
jgi:hypothetical protein